MRPMPWGGWTKSGSGCCPPDTRRSTSVSSSPRIHAVLSGYTNARMSKLPDIRFLRYTHSFVGLPLILPRFPGPHSAFRRYKLSSIHHPFLNEQTKIHDYFRMSKDVCYREFIKLYDGVADFGSICFYLWEFCIHLNLCNRSGRIS